MKPSPEYISDALAKEEAELDKHGLVAIEKIDYEWFKGRGKESTIEELKEYWHSGAEFFYCKRCPDCGKPRVVGTTLKNAIKARAVCQRCSNKKKVGTTLPPREKQYTIIADKPYAPGAIIKVVIKDGVASILKRGN